MHSKAAFKGGLFWYNWGEFWSRRVAAQGYSTLSWPAFLSPLFPKRELNDKDSPIPAGPSLLVFRMPSQGWTSLSSYMWQSSHPLMLQRLLSFGESLVPWHLPLKGGYKGPSQEAFCSVWNSKAACAHSSRQPLLLIMQWGCAEGGLDCKADAVFIFII